MFKYLFLLMKNNLAETKSKIEKQKNILEEVENQILEGNYKTASKIMEKYGFKVTGQGEYKIVYSLGSQRVFKLAKSGLGTSDIANEVRATECAPEIMPKIYKSGIGWAIVERIKHTLKNDKNIGLTFLNYFELDLNELNKHLDIQMFRGYRDILNFIRDYRRHKQFSPEYYKTIMSYFLSKNKFREFLKSITKCNISLYDLHLNNFGFREDGSFVIIDLFDESTEYNFDV